MRMVTRWVAFVLVAGFASLALAQPAKPALPGAGAGNAVVKITVDTPGSGEPAKVGDFVSVHYTGWIANGAQFDTSRGADRSEPIVFRLGAGQVIPGWDQGVTGMKAGEKRTLLIPPALGYGAAGYGPIPPNATLKFEVELVMIHPAVQVTVTKAGEGKVVAAGNFVDLHYTGSLPDGTTFAKSAEGKPATLALGSGLLTPGLDEALSGMKVGTKATVLVPPVQGFTKDERPGNVPPEAPLRFEVELRDVRPGVTHTIQKSGAGPGVQVGDKARVHYTGYLADTNAKFDSSRDHGNTLDVPVGTGRVIKGWDIGLVGMQVGEKRTLMIPPEWGYGAQGAGRGRIPPNATLKFEVELVEIVK